MTGKVVWQSGDDMPGYAPPIMATLAGKRQMIAFTAIAVIGVDPVNGGELWRIPVKTALGRHAATPIAFEDFVVVSSHQAGMIGIKVSQRGNGLKAEIAWNNKEAAINFAAPVSVGSSLFGVGPNKNLICVDIPTGKILWSKDSFFTSNGGKAYAGMIVMGKNLLILADDGQLVMISADSSAYHEVGRTQGCGTNWCNPAYADGKLFLRDANELRCLDLMR
jgi:outer membrane protein assembly factor BamB